MIGLVLVSGMSVASSVGFVSTTRVLILLSEKKCISVKFTGFPILAHEKDNPIEPMTYERD